MSSTLAALNPRVENNLTADEMIFDRVSSLRCCIPGLSPLALEESRSEGNKNRLVGLFLPPKDCTVKMKETTGHGFCKVNKTLTRTLALHASAVFREKANDANF